MEKYAMSRDEGIREDQVRSRMCQEHLMGSDDLLKELIKEGEEEQMKGQRGLTRFLNCWRRELDRERRLRSRSDSDWSLIPTRTETPVTSPEQAPPPIPTASRTSSSFSTPPPKPEGDSSTMRTPPTGPHIFSEALKKANEVGELKIAPPGLYKSDRKAGTGEATEPMENIARAIQSQTAELATLVRHQAEGGGAQPVGTVKGLNRQSEEMVFLMRACGQYHVQVGAGEHGPYWGINEKHALSASDFLSYTDAELDQFASEHKISKGPSDQRPPPPTRFDEWVARVRRQTDIWCLLYGEEWRTVRVSALDLLSEWHLAYPHRWPLPIIMDLWEELSWRLIEEFKEILRRLKKEVGRETLTLNELRFHALLPGPDGQAWLQMPTTFDLERPDSWFQTEVIPRIERKQERLLWNLTWQNGARREKPQNAGPPVAGANEPEKPTIKSLWGPKLSTEEVNKAKERAPLDRQGNLLCWGHLCHVGCSTTNCQRSHEGLRGTFESLDPCVQMQMLKRGGLKRMKVETKESVNQKIKDIRQRIEKDRQSKIQDGKRKDGRAGEKDAGENVEEGPKAGGVRAVRFWDVPEEFHVDYTQSEDIKDLVKGPNEKWGDNVYKPSKQHAGREGHSAPEEARRLVRDAKLLGEKETLRRLEGASDDLYAWAAARVAREPEIEVSTLLSEMATFGLGEVAREAADLLEENPTSKAGSARLTVGLTSWTHGCPGKGTMTLDGHQWDLYDFQEEVHMTDELAGLLKVNEPVIEKRQCVTLAIAAAVLWLESGQVPAAEAVQRKAQLYRLEQTRLALEAAQLLGEPEEIVTAVEHEMRVYIHDLTTAHHEKDFRSLAVFPISDLQEVKVVVLRTDYKGGVIVESVVGPHWKAGNPVIWVLIHKGHMTLIRPPSPEVGEQLLEEEEHTTTPSFGFTFFWHSRHDQAPTSPGRTHCRLCRTSRKAGNWTDCFRPHSCLASVAAVAGGGSRAQVIRGVRPAGAPHQAHELVMQEVFAGMGRITTKWQETAPVEEPIEVFAQPHLRKGYQQDHDLLLPANRKRMQEQAREGPANVWWLAAPCTSFCDWQLQNGGTRTFQHPEGGLEGPQQQRENDGNALSTWAADTFEDLLDQGAFPICESSAASGRYPKQWDLPAWRRVLNRSDVEYIEFPMCAFGLGPPDQPGHYYVHRTRLVFPVHAPLREALLRVCPGQGPQHVHVGLKGCRPGQTVTRCTEAGAYSWDFVTTIVRAADPHFEEAADPLLEEAADPHFEEAVDPHTEEAADPHFEEVEDTCFEEAADPHVEKVVDSQLEEATSPHGDGGEGTEERYVETADEEQMSDGEDGEDSDAREDDVIVQVSPGDSNLSGDGNRWDDNEDWDQDIGMSSKEGQSDEAKRRKIEDEVDA
eukprot:s669_g10.t1